MVTPATQPAVDYSFLRKLVYDQSQNVLDPSRNYLFETRLTKILHRHGLSHLQDLVHLLRSRRDPVLERSVAEAMTINETSFFRDGRPFELLRSELLPGLIESRRATRTLRLWSAACSTGQEAYSIAMLLLEHFPALANWNIQIEGTDISREVIQQAQAAAYHRIEINRGLPARHILRFFDHRVEGSRHEEWIAKPELRKLCRFRQANLCAPASPFNPSPLGFQPASFDVIFLRNVMLYFSPEMRRKLLANIHRLLTPDGLLFLGSSEQPADPAIWSAILANGTCHYRPRKPS